MAWDDDKKGNPWQPNDKGPADLDAIVRDLQRKLTRLLGGGRGGGGDQGGGDHRLGSGLIGLGIVIALVVWAMLGWYTIDAAERGVVLRFGRFVAMTQPGLRWHLPWPIETVEKVNTGATERWPYQGSMLTRDENIVEVDLIVQYRRTDPREFLFSLRDPEETLRDVTASAIREIIGKNNLDFILTQGREEIADQTHELLQSTLDTYETGITVYEVNLQEANFPSAVEVSVQDAIKAREDRARAILEAESYANDILPRARGAAERQKENAEAYRAQVVANAEGEANRFLAILQEYEKAPEVTRERMYIDTLEDVLSRATKVLVDTDGGNNLLYLPLDQLMQRRSGTATPSDNGSITSAPLSSTPPQSDTRLRGTR